MQLGTSLSYIEDIKESVQKRYNALKAMLKKYNEIPSGEKNRAVKYAKEMSEDATKHYFKVKHQVEEISKTDRVAKQIVRNMSSIESYKDKIYKICNYESK